MVLINITKELINYWVYSIN